MKVYYFASCSNKHWEVWKNHRKDMQIIDTFKSVENIENHSTTLKQQEKDKFINPRVAPTIGTSEICIRMESPIIRNTGKTLKICEIIQNPSPKTPSNHRKLF